MTDIRVRRARLSDLSRLGQLSRDGAEADYQLHPPEVRALIARRHSTKPLLFALIRTGRVILVGEVAGKVQGLLVGTPNSDGVGVVQWLYVAPGGRSHGMARRLLSSFEDIARQSGSHKLMAWTEIASGYYQKIGWTEEVKLPNHWWGKDFSIVAKYL